MNDLHVLTLRDSYHKGVNDIASEFYLPCMSAAKSYDRAVGFFSSTIYILAWPALRDFVQRGGRIRLLCSPFLAAQDTAAIELGYTAKTEESVGQLLREEISGMLKDSNLQKPTRLLAALVAIGVVEIKIVFLEPHADGRAKGILHDKVGIFSDEGGNVVVFKGSMNETWLGLAADGNIESIDVFASWAGPDAVRRVDTHVEYFRSLWENSYPMVTVRRFPEIARAELMKAADIEHWTDLADEILREMASASAIQGEIRLSGPEPRAHQLAALDGWFRQNRRGILEHATGSGKTLTAILAMRDSMKRSEVPIVLVPTQVLLDQWVSDITDAFGMAGVQLLCCGAGHAQWKDQDLLRIWSKPSPNHRVIIATVQTASSDEFLGSLTQGSHLFLIADEVHRLGSPKNQRILTIQSGPRLGLSATPRRAGDPVGTQAVFDYFGGIVEPPFTLRDAIRAKLLTPYMYHPRT